jgi:hypothetical protein
MMDAEEPGVSTNLISMTGRPRRIEGRSSRHRCDAYAVRRSGTLPNLDGKLLKLLRFDLLAFGLGYALDYFAPRATDFAAASIATTRPAGSIAATLRPHRPANCRQPDNGRGCNRLRSCLGEFVGAFFWCGCRCRA